MSATLCAAVVAAGLAAGQPEPAPKSATVRRADLDEFLMKTNGVVFNNFQLSEQRAIGRDTVHPEHQAPDIAVRGTFRNGTGQRAEYTVVVVGVDAAGELLWACHMQGSAPARDVGVFSGSAAVPRDTLRQTAAVRIRARLAPPAMPPQPPFPLPTGQP